MLSVFPRDKRSTTTMTMLSSVTFVLGTVNRFSLLLLLSLLVNIGRNYVDYIGGKK